MSEQMDMAEIEENIHHTEKGDHVRVVVADGREYEGDAVSVKTNIRNLEFNVTLETDDGEMVSVEGSVFEPDAPDINSPYLDGIYFKDPSSDKSREFIDAYEVIS